MDNIPQEPSFRRIDTNKVFMEFQIQKLEKLKIELNLTSRWNILDRSYIKSNIRETNRNIKRLEKNKNIDMIYNDKKQLKEKEWDV